MTARRSGNARSVAGAKFSANTMSTEITTRVTESTGEVTDRVAYPCSARLQKNLLRLQTRSCRINLLTRLFGRIRFPKSGVYSKFVSSPFAASCVRVLKSGWFAVTDFASYLLYHCHSCQEVCFNPVTDRRTRYRECRGCHSVLLFLAHRANGWGVAKHLRAMPDAVQVHRKRAPDDDGHVEEDAADPLVTVGARSRRQFGNVGNRAS